MRSWILAVFAAGLTLAACAGKNSPMTDNARSSAIRDSSRSIVDQRGVPGIAVAVIRRGKPFEQLVYGFADGAGRVPITGATAFQLASTTKIFASTGVLLLVADGKVHLDDPIGAYLDGLPAAWRKVTVRQLMSHTSGLPDITRRTGELDLVADNWDAALQKVAGAPLQFQPGHSWAYTQTNYALLQRLVERVSGVSFEDFLAARLFAPLGLHNTFFPDTGRPCAGNFRPAPNGKIAERDLSFPRFVHAAGGLCSSLEDLVLWTAALDSGAVVPPGLMEQAWAPTTLADGADARITGAMSYGLGWVSDTAPGHRWVGHSGGNSTAYRRYLDDHMTIIVLHNGMSDPDAIAGSIAGIMLATTGAANAQADLWDAATDGDKAAVDAALRAGAEVNALDTRSSRNGRFALNWAAINNHPDIIELLLAHGAAIDAANQTGFTALHHAAEAGSTDAAKSLLAAGADRTLRTDEGETAADVARRKGNAALARLIEQAPRKSR